MLAKRNTNLDVIRCIAVFEVISIHFFLNNGFYSTIVNSFEMYKQICFRTFFMSCVPLFMILSGYLMSNKALSLKYYFKISKIIVIYCMSSIACQIYYYFIAHEEPFTIKQSILKILGFEGSAYAWYVNMYIGLFLIIPFINLIYKGLKDKKQKRGLLLILSIVTLLPSITNIYNFNVDGWFATPYLSSNHSVLFTDWWTCLYPITYYFIGTYIKEFKPCIKKWKILIAIISTTILFSGFNFYRSYCGNFESSNYNGLNGIENCVIATLVFIFIMSIDFSKVNMLSKIIIKIVSESSLAIYLVSWIFDDKVYTALRLSDFHDLYGLRYYLKIVPMNFLKSLAIAIVITLLYKQFAFLHHVLKSKMLKISKLNFEKVSKISLKCK